jgi:SAM-dependent methyltransferase
MKTEITKNYYSSNAKDYVQNTLSVDISLHYSKFLSYLPKEGTILDVGFGSGRDTSYFSSLGYDTLGIDNVQEFVEWAKTRGLKVAKVDFNEMDFINEFDGIWACASLLHSPNLELSLEKIYTALKDNGYLYISMKEGNGERTENGRYFRYVSEKELTEICAKRGLKLVELYKTTDLLKRDNIWLNGIFRKCLHKDN